MKINAVTLRLLDGTIQERQVRSYEKEENGIHAVYIKGFSKASLQKNVNLDGDFGAAIEFDIDSVESWMADFRKSEFWCLPEFGTELKKIPDETQGLVYKKKNGTFGVILPVVSEKYKCVLCGNENGGVVAKLMSWTDKLCYCDALAFLYAEGENPYALLNNAAKYGMKLLNHGCRTREERRYPELFEYLGWCSWDAMQIYVNEDDLVKKCQEFQDKDIPVKWAILDDMWAEVHDFYDADVENVEKLYQVMHSSKLYSFKADPKRFPNGLKHCIGKINEFGIKVGMWHPTTGYWMGIDPEGEIFAKHRDTLMETKDGRYIHSYELDKAYKFYDAFHTFLRNAGAEFVKIDNQSMTRRFYRGFAPVGEVSRSFHNAMEASVGQHFDNTMINCMGMASEDMWNRPVSAISRCSDDFQPENSEWFSKNAITSSYNCLIQGQFYYCDWDMWWTDDKQAEKNSLLRAISGGPIYISDKLDRSRAEVLKPLCFEDGKILRCDRPAMPTKDCITINPLDSGKLFKLQNIANGSGVVAVFNLDGDGRAVCGTVSPSEVDGLEGEEFAVYEHFSRELQILKREESFELSLANINQYRLYIIVPIQDGFAPIGRIDKFISPKSILGCNGQSICLVEDGEYAYVENEKLIIRK